MITFSEPDSIRQAAVRARLLESLEGHKLTAAVSERGRDVTITAVGPEDRVRQVLPEANRLVQGGMIVMVDAEYLPLIGAAG